MKKFKFNKRLYKSKDNPSRLRILQKFKRKLDLNPTKAELKFKSILSEINIKYFQNKGFFRGGAKTFCIVDFFIPKPYFIAFEIDGSSHRNRKAYDNSRTKYLNSIGIQVFRFPNSEVLNNTDCARNKVELILAAVNAEK